MLRKLGILAASAAGALVPNMAEAQQKPNVLLIYVDDLGTLDMNCYGSTDLITPNMDKLAADGVRFTQFYGAPSSSPSRAALLTGQFCARAGLATNANEIDGLPAEKVTIAEAMKENGYATALIGKWHLGLKPDQHPNRQGFDYFWGHLGGCVDNYSNFFYWGGPNHHDLWCNDKEIWRENSFYPSNQVAELEKYVTEHRKSSPDQPFFIYWASNLPHYPLQATEKWREAYKDVPNPRGQYAAFVSTLDEKIGEVVDFIDREGLRDNTIIILQSDNGHSVEIRNFGGGGNAGPYRGAKFSLFEGGIRMPAIISYPKVLPKGEVRDQVAMCTDWFPTVAELCDINMAKYPIDGKSLVKVMRKDSPTEHAVLHFDSGRQWAVRKDDWKLSGNPLDPVGDFKFPESDSIFLTNLKIDASERMNMAAEYPEVVKELRNLRNEYVKSLKTGK